MNTTVKNNLIRVASFAVDVLCIFLCFYLSKKVVCDLTGEKGLDYKFLIAYEICMIFFFVMFDLYAAKENTRADTFVSVILSTLASTVCIFIVNFLFHWNYRALLFWLLMGVILIILLESWRLFLSFSVAKFREKKKILILESSTVPSRLARKIKYSCNNINTAWYYIINEENTEEVNCVLNEILPDYDSVFISSALSKDLSDHVFHRAMMLRKSVSILATLSNVSTMGGTIHQFGDTPVIEEHGIWLSKIQRFMKRSFDIAFALSCILLTSPFFIVFSIAIKLDSPGPIFYYQERYTIYKRKFKLCKFRTMVVDAEKYGAQLSSKDDPRVTRVGKIIRMLRLDELPQFLNILSGSMSVVGPRPERPIFADDYCEKVKDYQMRYYFKAGLTGYAQVYGKYNTRASDKILMDMIYATKYSFWLDIKLILLTIKTMFIKSSTDGVEDELDQILGTTEKELERIKNSSYREGEQKNSENISHSARV